MFIENLDLFFDVFGVDVELDGFRGKGILDAPTNVIGSGMVLSNEYLLTVKTSEFGHATYGYTLKVNASDYQVRESRQIDDGAFSEILLTKV